MFRPIARSTRGSAGRTACQVLGLVLVLALAGCGADREFDAALRANTVVAFDDYLRLHPDGAHAAEARTRLAALLEAREWERALAANNLDGYQQYLRGYPQGQHSHDALTAIADLNMATLPSTEAGTPPGTVTPRGAARAPVPESAVTHPAVQGAIARPPPPADAAVPAAKAPAPVAKPMVAAAKPPAPVAAPKAAKIATVAAAPARTAAVASGGVSIQLGAFSTEVGAKAAWRKLAARYPELGARSPLLAAAKLADGRSVERLQVTGFSRDSAAAMCSALKTAHDACLIVASSGPAAN